MESWGLSATGVGAGAVGLGGTRAGLFEVRGDQALGTSKGFTVRDFRVTFHKTTHAVARPPGNSDGGHIRRLLGVMSWRRGGRDDWWI